MPDRHLVTDPAIKFELIQAFMQWHLAFPDDRHQHHVLGCVQTDQRQFLGALSVMSDVRYLAYQMIQHLLLARHCNGLREYLTKFVAFGLDFERG